MCCSDQSCCCCLCYTTLRPLHSLLPPRSLHLSVFSFLVVVSLSCFWLVCVYFLYFDCLLCVALCCVCTHYSFFRMFVLVIKLLSICFLSSSCASRLMYLLPTRHTFVPSTSLFGPYRLLVRTLLLSCLP